MAGSGTDGPGPGGWADETYLKLALHALDEVAQTGGEIGLLRDLYLQPGPICAGATGLGAFPGRALQGTVTLADRVG